MTVADLISGDGFYRLPHCTSRYNPIETYNSIRWPTQGYPSERAWALWRRAIKKCLPIADNGRLLEPLGRWMPVDSAWGAFFDQPPSSLYVKDMNHWKHYTPNTQLLTGSNPQYTLADHSKPPTQCTHIAMAWHHDGSLVHHGIGRLDIPTLDSQSDWTIEWSNTVDNQLTQDIQAAIHAGTAIALTDGSFKDRKGAAG